MLDVTFQTPPAPRAWPALSVVVVHIVVVISWRRPITNPNLISGTHGQQDQLDGNPLDSSILPTPTSPSVQSIAYRVLPGLTALL